jgi:hypothetical protein
MAKVKSGCSAKYFDVPARMLKTFVKEMQEDCAYCNTPLPKVINANFEMPVKDMVIGKTYNFLAIEHKQNGLYNVYRAGMERLS